MCGCCGSPREAGYFCGNVHAEETIVEICPQSPWEEHESRLSQGRNPKTITPPRERTEKNSIVMAGRKRIIESDLGRDEHIIQLSDFEFRVYVLALPHTDDWGRFIADAGRFKMEVDPYNEAHPAHDYQHAIKRIAELGLWRVYKVGGKLFLQYKEKTFERVNKFLIKHRTAPLYPSEGEAVTMSTIQDTGIEQWIIDCWGKRDFDRMGHLILRKLVDLKIKHGWEKFARAIEYAAERDAKNYRYVLAILEPKTTGEKVESKKAMSALKLAAQESERRASKAK